MLQRIYGTAWQTKEQVGAGLWCGPLLAVCPDVLGPALCRGLGRAAGRPAAALLPLLPGRGLATLLLTLSHRPPPHTHHHTHPPSHSWMLTTGSMRKRRCATTGGWARSLTYSGGWAVGGLGWWVGSGQPPPVVQVSSVRACLWSSPTATCLPCLPPAYPRCLCPPTHA